jgi:D-serine deaminase-like pyridoxal phosphate-dependent protein
MRSATVIEVPAGSEADNKVMSLDRLSTPALVLERGTLDRNIERLTARLQRLGVTLRPHLKTAKSRDVARRRVPPRLRADHRINAEGSRVLRGRRRAGRRLCGWAGPPQDQARSCSARTGRRSGGSHRHADPGPGAGRLNPRVRPTIGLLPNHACATGAQHEVYNVVAGTREVHELWPRMRGW